MLAVAAAISPKRRPKNRCTVTFHGQDWWQIVSYRANSAHPIARSHFFAI